ncbi:unnamed protein product [Tilletia controversa]|uniref:Major facilitator superfamily (MFS) profile domain-containing protein n=3 Tax=Tilletia TaxID=13289 RepID=A0A8X7SXF9_9BASI|nr:hypothetical protein CF336_g3792 [Tilletia laevis]KAE8198729.1 hypothetical protein CF328_g3466 [Tilletia controversa]KAE8261615.1 hypothetical protein A4X03_0g3104 [Tilletia caries]KAE8203611.1 hypothetical protein CF335_g2949 [Tilletia laevis]KAE8247739.1 hypothetical protein A4X06_0g4231 [Tilletia controversa]
MQQRRLPEVPLLCIARHPKLLANLVVVSVAATTVLQSLVNGALTVATPSIADDLGLPPDQLQWPIACFSLSNGALLLIAGAIADTIAGRRITFLAGLTAFTISAVGTAFVRSGAELSALCACMGAAAAMLSPAGVGILAGCLPDDGQFKSRAFAALGAGQPIGFIVGLLLGGILSTGGHWRLIFWITAGIGFIFLGLCIAVLPLDGTTIVFQRRPLPNSSATRKSGPPVNESDSTRHITSGAATPARRSISNIDNDSNNQLERITSIVAIDSEFSRTTLRQALWHFDWLGAFLSTSGLVLLTFALADAETAPQGWKTPYIPAMLPLSILALTSFVLWERRLERAAIAKRSRGEPGLTFEPLLPPAVWRAPRFSLLLTIIFAAWLSFNCLSYFITLMIQLIQDVSPLQTSIRFLPMIFVGILINFLSGWLLPKIRPVWMITIGSTGGCAAAILFALISPKSSYFPGMFLIMVLVVATDFAFPVAQLYSVRSVGRQHAALAGSLFATTVRVASSIGLALTSTISTAVARQYAHSHTDVQPTDPDALLRGYRAAGWTCASFSLFAVVLAFIALRDVAPLRSEETRHEEKEAVVGDAAGLSRPSDVERGIVAAAEASGIQPALLLVTSSRVSPSTSSASGNEVETVEMQNIGAEKEKAAPSLPGV